jgi:hypothetical protein
MGLHRSLLLPLSAGVLVGALSTAGVLFAQRTPAPPAARGEPTFQLVDTPGSTFLLNQGSGEVWRIGFTEVKGERYWFGTHVPLQEASTFDEFQQRLLRQLEGARSGTPRRLETK